MPVYHFVVHWDFTAPIEKVWKEIANPQDWPHWWRCWREVRPINTAGELKVGSSGYNVVRSRLPYSLHFTTTVTGIQPPDWMEVDSTGDLLGTGRWELEAKEDVTAVTYYWDVGTSNRLLNLLSRFKFVKTMVEDNHDYVMEQGYQSLTARLQASAAPILD